MNKRPKKESFPAIDGLECIKRISGGTGFSRFEARMPATGVVGELVTIDSPDELDTSWIQSLVQTEDNPWPPIIMSEKGIPAWILFEMTPGDPLDKALARPSGTVQRLEALSISVQCWVLIARTHARGIGHGKVSASAFRLALNEDGYPDVRLSNWQPPTSRSETVRQADLAALFDLTKTLLKDDTRQVEVADLGIGEMEEATVDEMLDAILSGPRPDSARMGLERLAPILEKALASRFRETQQILDCESSFIEEVEQQRVRLRELETHQRFIRDWLYVRDEQIEVAQDTLSRSQTKLRDLDNLRMRIDLSISALHVPFQPGSETSHIVEPNQTKYDLDDFGISEAPPEIPAEPVESSLATSTQASQPTRSAQSRSDNVRIGLIPVLAFIAVLVLIGGLTGAWFLEQSKTPVDDSMAVAALKNEKTAAVALAESMPVPNSKIIAESNIKIEKRSDAAIRQAVSTDADVSQRTLSPTAGTVRKDAGLKTTDKDTQSTTSAVVDAAQGVDMGSQVKPLNASAQSDSAPQIGSQNMNINTPEGMVFIARGILKLGLNTAQAARLETMCKANRNTPAMRADCSAIKSEIRDDELVIDRFFLDTYEVAQGKFEDCIKSGICQQRRPYFDVSHFPATGVSFINAKRYCTFAKKRLPTIEELQYATRGPGGDRIYPWGDESPNDPKIKRANLGQFRGESEAPNSIDGFKYAAPVKAFADVDSPFGAINLAGNVREWTQSKSTRGMYAFGGGWISASDRLRVTRKDDLTKNMARGDLGFRCARSIGPKK